VFHRQPAEHRECGGQYRSPLPAPSGIGFRKEYQTQEKIKAFTIPDIVIPAGRESFLKRGAILAPGESPPHTVGFAEEKRRPDQSGMTDDKRSK
jgi:hypothetical protein